MKVYMVGAGMGSVSGLTQAAKTCITQADVVVTTARLFNNLGGLNANMVCKDMSAFSTFINEQKGKARRICVLVSGDVGFFSISKSLQNSLQGVEVEVLNGLSSLQVLAARLGVSYDDVKPISAHGREGHVVPFVCYNPKVFVLSGGQRKAHDIITELNTAGLGHVKVSVGENLSDDSERIVTNEAQNFAGMRFENLAAILIENDRYVKHNTAITDKEFIRGKIPMTKEAVRTLSIAALRIEPSDCVADIGAGTGSVSIEMARKAYEGVVLAVEKNQDALTLLQRNIEKFGAYNVLVKAGVAPMADFPAVDKAFIGGSGGNLKDIVSGLLHKNPRTRLVVNAVTIETLSETVECFKAQQLKTTVTCVNISNAERIGSYHLMKAENPIYIISGERHE